MVLKILISAILMMSLDGLWIGLIAKAPYFSAYGHVLNIQNGQLLPVWWAAGLVYVFLIFGVHYYGLSHLSVSWKQAVLQSAIFGWVVYGVYDFTCLALFKSWPLTMTLVDFVWGGVLCGMTALLTIFICRFI